MTRFRFAITGTYELPGPEVLLEAYGTEDPAKCAALDAQADPEILVGGHDGDLAVTVVPVSGETPGQQLYASWCKAFESHPQVAARSDWEEMSSQARASWEAIAPLAFSQEQSLQACRGQLEAIAERLSGLGQRRMARMIRDTLDLTIT